MATGFTFGAAKPVTAGGFSLGTGTTPTLGAPQAGITFGTPVGQVNPTPQFGAAPIQNFSANTSVAPSFNFNTPASTPSLNFKPPTSTMLPGFGSTPITSGISFGTTAAAPAPTSTINFNLGPTNQIPGGINFGMSAASTPGLTLGTPSTASNTLPFGILTSKPPATTSTLSLNFGSTIATSGLPQTTLNFSQGSTAPLTGLTLAKPTITSAAPVGLGGIATTQAKTGVPAPTSQSETPPKDTALPNEILQIVEQFKSYVKEQKSMCSDIARHSCKEFETVHIEIASILNILTEVENDLQKNRQLAEKLKYDTARGLQHTEMAQRTHDIPPGLQYDNIAPLQYFVDLVNGFEKILQALKIQVDITEKHAKSRGQVSALTPQELTIGMRRLHETFVALAGRLQSVHTQVESQKKEYLNLRKYLLGDTTNVFEVASKEAVALEVAVNSVLTPPKIAPGPTPFSSFGGPFVPNTAPPTYPGAGPTSMGLQNAQGANLAKGPPEYPYAKPKPNQGFLFSTPETSAFQLQKPPAGNKRGKH